MISEVDYVVGEVGFLLCDLLFSLKYPKSSGYKIDKFALFVSACPVLLILFLLQLKNTYDFLVGQVFHV